MVNHRLIFHFQVGMLVIAAHNPLGALAFPAINQGLCLPLPPVPATMNMVMASSKKRTYQYQFAKRSWMP